MKSVEKRIKNLNYYIILGIVVFIVALAILIEKVF